MSVHVNKRENERKYNRECPLVTLIIKRQRSKHRNVEMVGHGDIAQQIIAQEY
jgi:hypothetical protein